MTFIAAGSTTRRKRDHRVSEFTENTGYQAYAAKVGRARQIEVYFVVPANWPTRTLEQWDALRDQIGEAIGPQSPDRWLTIAFTTDPAWTR